MRTHWLAAPILGLVLGLVAAPAAPTLEPAAVAKLVAQLGSSEFEEREKATTALDALGEAALPALRQAAEKSDDPEVRMRSAELVRKIEKRLESAAVLAPTRVHLVYKDTPLPEAVADFSKKAGAPIVLNDPEGKLKERKITLDTGDVTFFQALDLFCAKAGLVESNPFELVQPIRPIGRPIIRPLPPQPVPPQALPRIEGKPGVEGKPVETKPVEKQLPPQPEKRQEGEAKPAVEGRRALLVAQPAQPAQPVGQIQIQIQVQPGQPGIQIQPALPPGGLGGVGGIGIGIPGQVNQIVLTDGTPKTQPTDARGAIRVRALEKADLLGAAPTGEILIGLQVTPEPRIRWQSLQKVTVTRAVDDHDQALMPGTGPQAPPVPLPGGPGALPGGGFGGPAIGAPAIAVPALWIGNGQMVPVYLKKGAKESKSLKELSGVITATVLAEPKAVITADDILKAAGKSFKGGEGGELKILEVAKNGDQYTVRFQFQQPGGYVPAPGAGPVGIGLPLNPGNPVPLPVPQPRIAVPPGGGVGVAPAIAMLPNFGNGLTLLDEKGTALELAAFPQTVARPMPGGGFTVEWIMVFQAQKGQTPAKFVFQGSRSVTVDIPFTLKEVPLP